MTTQQTRKRKHRHEGAGVTFDRYAAMAQRDSKSDRRPEVSYKVFGFTPTVPGGCGFMSVQCFDGHPDLPDRITDVVRDARVLAVFRLGEKVQA